MKRAILVAAMLSAGYGGRAQAAVGCIGSDSEDCRWTATDFTLQASMASLQLLDLMQTQATLRLNSDRFEGNPLLGQHPSPAKLWGLGSLAIVGHAAISCLLPSGWRKVWQSVGIIAETKTNVTNAVIGGGVRLALPF
jgi:hypothetical protein